MAMEGSLGTQKGRKGKWTLGNMMGRSQIQQEGNWEVGDGKLMLVQNMIL